MKFRNLLFPFWGVLLVFLFLQSCRTRVAIIKSKIENVKKSKKKYIESPFELLLNEMGNTIKSYRIGYIEGNVNFVSLFFENSETIALKQMNNKNYSGMTIFFGTENKETNKMFEEESYLKKRYDYKKNSLDKFENLKIINIDAYVEK